MELIKSKETRDLFLTKAGMPKKNYLVNMDQICEALGKPMPVSGPERYYARVVNGNVVRDTRKYFHSHHIMFIAPKIEGTVFYGFSTNQAHLDNYMERLKNKTKSHAIIESVAKSICNGQGELFGATQKNLLE